MRNDYLSILIYDLKLFMNGIYYYLLFFFLFLISDCLGLSTVCFSNCDEFVKTNCVFCDSINILQKNSCDKNVCCILAHTISKRSVE